MPRHGLEFELATANAELRRAQDELERVRKQLKTAELFVPIEARIAYNLELERVFDPPAWEEGTD